ncbi:unnamed protein product [Ascophyllum nodosum]
MSRSKWKTPFIERSLLKNLSIKKTKLIWSRRSTIYPAAVGLKLTIHNGKDMFTRKIKPEMVGHKLGEFVQTRKNFIPKQKKVVTIKQKK